MERIAERGGENSGARQRDEEKMERVRGRDRAEMDCDSIRRLLLSTVYISTCRASCKTSCACTSMYVSREEYVMVFM